MNSDDAEFVSGGHDLPRPHLRGLPAPDDDAPREMPASAEAEEQVLACCLIDGGITLARCLQGKLTPDAFYWPANALVFEALVEMGKRQLPITLEVLAEELSTMKVFEQVGGMPYLIQITGKIPTTAHAGYFIEKVREKFVLRKLIRCGTDLIEKTYQFTGGLDEFVGRHTLRLQRWADFVTRLGRPGQEEDAAAARLAALDIQAGKIDKSRQLERGLPYADEMFLPYDVANEDWLVIIAGGPSSGKSSRLREIVGHNCRNVEKEGVTTHKRFAVFLLETGSRRWRWALAANLAHVNLRMVLEEPARMLPGELKRWNDWNDEITRWAGERLWVYDDIYFFEDIERTVRELDRSLREKDLAAGIPPEKARGLDGVVIDYLQLMSIREKIRMREEQVAYMSKGCKRLGKTLNVTVCAGAQISRKSRDEERRPRLSDLRESGAIEQDADAVEILYVPACDKSGVAQTGERSVVEMELISAKRRNGPANIAVDVLFHRTQTRFADATRKGDPRPGAPMPKDGYKREERK